MLTEGESVNIFLYGDSVTMGKKGQKLPKGFYNLEEMLKNLIARGVEVRTCITCTRARGFVQEDFIEGVKVGKTLDLARWIKEGRQVLMF